MMIIFTPDDVIPCPKCEGTGYIPVDVYISDGKVGKVTGKHEFNCGVCEGEGYIFPDFTFDVEQDED